VTDSSELERVQTKFSAECYNRFVLDYVAIIMKARHVLH
jgi:hypothetical protein